MARDYRYGHKSSQPTQRRTQTSAVEEAKADKSTSVAKTGKAAVQQPIVQAVEPASSRRPSDVAAKVLRRRKIVTSQVDPDDVQKKKSEAYLSALPKQVRREIAEKEALAKAQAEAEAQLAAQLAVQQQEKRRGRMSKGMWLTMGLATLASIAWLLYAPFFLAFAVEMGWLDDATRNRFDPAAAIRGGLVTRAIDAEKDISKAATNTPAAVATPADPNVMTYSFYKELPKENVDLGVQPLPVRTHAPTYLQLASFANEKEAQAERKRIVQKGYLVQVNGQANKSGMVYVLRMGPYDDQRTINRLKVELQRLGVDAHEISLASVIKASEPAVTANATGAQAVGKIQGNAAAISRGAAVR